MLQAKMRGCFGGCGGGKSVTQDQSHTLFALTAGRAVAAVEVRVQVVSSWLQAVR